MVFGTRRTVGARTDQDGKYQDKTWLVGEKHLHRLGKSRFSSLDYCLSLHAINYCKETECSFLHQLTCSHIIWMLLSCWWWRVSLLQAFRHTCSLWMNWLSEQCFHYQNKLLISAWRVQQYRPTMFIAKSPPMFNLSSVLHTGVGKVAITITAWEGVLQFTHYCIMWNWM